MGKRQIRIFRSNIEAKKAEILDKPGHVILNNHVVFNGLIRAITDTHLTVEDLRFHKHVLPLSEITEVVYDKETVY